MAFAIIVSALSLTVTIAVKVFRGRHPDGRPAHLVPSADISLQQIHYTETKKGKKQWDMIADKAEYVKEKETTRLTGVRLVVAGEAATGDIALTADRADYHNKSGDVDLAGNVTAHSATGMEFVTQAAGYRAATGVLASSGRVRFSNGNLSVEGTGMELFVATRRVHVVGGVTAIITPGESK